MSHAAKMVSVVLAISVMSVSCSHQSQTSTVTFSQKSDGPVIVHLATRDRVITISSGIDGPVYTVKTRDGKILGEKLSADALHARFPEIEKFMDTTLAGQDEKSGRWIDASINTTPTPFTPK